MGKEKQELMSVESLIRIQNDAIEDTEYALKKKQSPKQRRANESCLKYYKSIKHHLSKLLTVVAVFAFVGLQSQVMIPDSTITDTIHLTIPGMNNWADQAEELMLAIDKLQNTVYYSTDGKEIPKRFNEVIISDYRGQRKKIIITNE